MTVSRKRSPNLLPDGTGRDREIDLDDRDAEVRDLAEFDVWSISPNLAAPVDAAMAATVQPPTPPGTEDEAESEGEDDPDPIAWPGPLRS